MARQPTPLYGNTPIHKRPPSDTPLRAWLRETGRTKFSLAKEVGCDPKMISYWCDGKAIPSLVYAFKLERSTRGGVPVVSWTGTDLFRLQWNNNGVDYDRWTEQKNTESAKAKRKNHG